jgi:hypothetical protein
LWHCSGHFYLEA